MFLTKKIFTSLFNTLEKYVIICKNKVELFLLLVSMLCITPRFSQSLHVINMFCHIFSSSGHFMLFCNAISDVNS